MDRRQNALLYLVAGIFGTAVLLIFAISEHHFASRHSWAPTAAQKKFEKLRQQKIREAHHPAHHE